MLCFYLCTSSISETTRPDFKYTCSSRNCCLSETERSVSCVFWCKQHAKLLNKITSYKKNEANKLNSTLLPLMLFNSSDAAADAIWAFSSSVYISCFVTMSKMLWNVYTNGIHAYTNSPKMIFLLFFFGARNEKWWLEQ